MVRLVGVFSVGSQELISLLANITSDGRHTQRSRLKLSVSAKMVSTAISVGSNFFAGNSIPAKCDNLCFTFKIHLLWLTRLKVWQRLTIARVWIVMVWQMFGSIGTTAIRMSTEEIISVMISNCSARLIGRK
jgi:hypothetical protein